MSGWNDLICFSHLRWDFVFQRPNHLMCRCARASRVFFFEEPIFTDATEGSEELGLEVVRVEKRLWRVTPRLPRSEASRPSALQRLLDDLIVDRDIRNPVLWYYTPMALDFSRD